MFEKAVLVNGFREGNEYGVTPGMYGVPFDMTDVQFIYNKDLFARAGLDPEKKPVTWQDFLEAGRKLKQKNIPFLVGGFGEIWLIDIMATGFAINIMGEEKVMKTYRGEVPYTDPDWIRVFEAFKTLADEGLLMSGTVTMVNKTAEQNFANGEAAVTWNGSWCVNPLKSMNPRLELGVFLPPRFDAGNPVKIWGGPGNSFMINARSPRRFEAAKFLRWIAGTDEQVYLSGETSNLPANRTAVAALPRVLTQFADDLDDTFHMNTMSAHENRQILEAFDKGIQLILIGEKSPQEVARGLQVSKEREIKRRAP